MPRLEAFDSDVRKKMLDFLDHLQHGAFEKFRKVAVFDADGTLWRGDLGEAFFQHQINPLVHQFPPNIPKKYTGANIWEHYERYAYDAKTAAQGLGWLVQWNAGVELATMQRWCAEFFEQYWKNKIFTGMQEWIECLHKFGVEVWVISGSMRWIVAAGVQAFHIPQERVIGTSVEVEAGVLTDRLIMPVPFQEGKKTWIDRCIGVPPIFGAGNTYWDRELLLAVEDKRGLALAIRSEQGDGLNFASEQKLFELAKSSGWLHQKFTNC